MSRIEKAQIQPNPETLIAESIALFGIDREEAARFLNMGLASFTLKGTNVGQKNRYRTTYEHGLDGDELTTYIYPIDPEKAGDHFTSTVIRIQPDLRGITFTDITSDESPIELNGIAAQEKIAEILASAQMDIAANS
jgi:hypothetical protein